MKGNFLDERVHNRKLNEVKMPVPLPGQYYFFTVKGFDIYKKVNEKSISYFLANEKYKDGDIRYILLIIKIMYIENRFIEDFCSRSIGCTEKHHEQCFNVKQCFKEIEINVKNNIKTGGDVYTTMSNNKMSEFVNQMVKHGLDGSKKLTKDSSNEDILEQLKLSIGKLFCIRGFSGRYGFQHFKLIKCPSCGHFDIIVNPYIYNGKIQVRCNCRRTMPLNWVSGTYDYQCKKCKSTNTISWYTGSYKCKDCGHVFKIKDTELVKRIYVPKKRKLVDGPVLTFQKDGKNEVVI